MLPDLPSRAPGALPHTIVHDADPGDLVARLAQAEAALRARDDFLAVAAHELRSPLHALALRVATLERIAAQSGHALLQRELHRTRRSVDRYVRRAVTLLDVSRMHAGALQPVPVEVRAADVVRSVVEDYREEAEFHGSTLDAEAEEDLCGWWDPHMIEQILANLVSNAIKYGNGTPVHVACRPAGTDEAVFEVSDRGPGIAEADRNRIFEKFERVVSRDAAGFGLGLWIIGRMVAAHHGTIAVTNRPEGGALFRVTLPLRAPGAEQQDDET
jgi:signal transduction histidine kinase